MFKYAEILSIDICVGAIGSGTLAALLLKAKMRPIWWFLLPAAVWVIYTADHLLDARKIKGEIVNARHKFHSQHFTVLACLAALVAIGCFAGAFFYLSDIVLKGGAVLCLLVAIHLVLAFWGKVRFGKEVSVAIIYSLGVWFGPYLNRGCIILPIHIIAFLFFMLAAVCNLFMNSIMEYDLDKRERLRFATGIFSLDLMRNFVMIASWLSSLAIMIILKYGIRHRIDLHILAGYFFLLILCAVPGFIILKESFFKKNRRYRLQGEWIYSLGILLMGVPQ